MEKIMNVENEWDQMAEADMVEGPVEEVTYEEVIKAMYKMKLGKAAGPSEVNMDNNGERKVWCGSTNEAASESSGWKRYARGMENKCCCSNL